ncbi:three-helix bundle dimerization domain-containing protein [Corynebacterium pseudogenitalium]|uniref:three-helix bundle dimerization domain-containing protein n=1 Tax=Corynebacterium pseudogenitalium TaxID=38303 RepID=UPI003B9E0C29
MQIQFNTIQKRVLRNIRHDLLEAWTPQFSEAEINNTFDTVLAEHCSTATVEDFIPVLVEAEMLNRLRTDSLLASLNSGSLILNALCPTPSPFPLSAIKFPRPASGNFFASRGRPPAFGTCFPSSRRSPAEKVPAFGNHLAFRASSGRPTTLFPQVGTCDHEESSQDHGIMENKAHA